MTINNTVNEQIVKTTNEIFSSMIAMRNAEIKGTFEGIMIFVLFLCVGIIWL